MTFEIQGLGIRHTPRECRRCFVARLECPDIGDVVKIKIRVRCFKPIHSDIFLDAAHCHSHLGTTVDTDAARILIER